MVFFTCNACGQSVKKNQVEKHYKLQCRNCEVLSCMDCGKDFHGDEYMNHTKCVSEDQKYGGKDYKPKSNINKGEAKQEEWILQIQNRIDTTNVRPALAQLLKQLMTFNNIPRNVKKFQKFLENSLKIYNKALIQEAWEIFNGTKEHKSKLLDKENGCTEPTSESLHNTDQKHKRPNDGSSSNSTNHSTEVINEEHMTKKHKKKHKTMNNHVEQENGKLNKEYSSGPVKLSSESTIEAIKTKKSKKSKKNKCMDNENAQEQMPATNISMESEMENSSIISNDDVGKGKKKFKWKKVIKAILKSSSDNEISLKKLQKKVLAEYYAAGGEPQPMSENELRAMFRKKVTSNPKFKLHKERVMLIS